MHEILNIPQPDWYSEHPIIDIHLETRIEDIPEGGLCKYCGTQREKGYTTYVCGVNILVRAENTACYYCTNPDCGDVELCIEAVYEALQKAREVLLMNDEEETAKNFEKSIESKAEILQQRKSS